jgi:2-oxoglutarate ferredoxin oxidoreductase subunit alpha
MAGLKAMTATSGPGISLYSEQISFAIGSEIPIVIVDVQRLGPSTGSATRGADGDIQFLRWGNSGGLPVIVLAPSNVEECFSLTQEAFNLAETFRCPVFIASNKDIAMTRESVTLDLAGEFEQKNRVRAPGDKQFQPFQTRAGDLVPDFLPIGDATLVRQTSSTHGPDGYITTDPVIIQETRDRLRTKLTSSLDQFTFFEAFLEDHSDTLIITYGITSRAAKEVFEEQKEKGKPVSLLTLKTLWPIPEKLIKQKAERFKKIMVVEMNLGQYVREIVRILPDKSISFMGQMDGNLITPSAIKRRLTSG